MPSSFSVAAARDSVTRGVLAFVGAQERFFSDHGTYTADTTLLRTLTPEPLPPGVQIQVLDAQPAGYALEGTHPAFTGRSCVLLAGSSPAIVVPLTRSQRRAGRAAAFTLPVVCDDA